MADVSKLNVNGTSYNVKDTTARSKISTIEGSLTALNTRVTALETGSATKTELTDLSDEVYDYVDSELSPINSSINSLTDRIEALESQSSSISLILFEVDGVICTCYSDYNWGQFVSSAFNNNPNLVMYLGYPCIKGTISGDVAYYRIKASDTGVIATGTQTIVANASYVK